MSTELTHKERFISLCHEHIHREGINELLEWLESSDFYTAPASTRFHGNYTGGLCEHSLNVFDQLAKLNEVYNIGATMETIAIIALFHDVCKVNYYKLGTRNVKNDLGQWVTKDVWEVDEKVPLGHGEKSCMLLQWYIKLNLDELLAIRWHMNGFDSAVKGGDRGLSKAQEMSPLVTLLFVADLISTNLFEKTVE